jgi:hypothetical protein
MPACLCRTAQPRVLLDSAVLLLAAICVALTAAPGAQAAGTWNPESYLASPLREATGPSVAVAATGAAVAGWQAEQGTPISTVDAFLATRAAGGTGPFAMGGTRQEVDTTKAHTEGDMAVTTAVNPSGKAVVAWVQATFTGNFRVQAVVRAAGASSFGPVQTLTAEGEDAGVPAVAINAAGAAVLVWRRHETATESWQVQGAELTNSGTTFTPLNGGGNISDEPDDDFDPPIAPPLRVAIAPSGAAVVTWDSTSAGFGIVARWARRGPGDAAFGTVHALDTTTHSPDVAAGDDGTFALTWVTGIGGTGATLSLARATTGNFGTAIPVGSTPSSFGSSRVGVDGDGNAIVAVHGFLTTDLAAKRRLGVTRCPAAGACGPLNWISTEDQHAQAFDLAVNADGDAVLAWSRSNGTRELIEASLHADGGGWDAPVFISGTGQDAHAPTVGIDGGGNVTAAWTAANVALFAVRQTNGAVEGATAPPTDPGGPGGPGDPGGPGGPGNPPGTPGGGGGGTTPPPPAADTAVSATVKQAAKATATAAGSFAGPKVTCSEAAGRACRVVVSFTTLGPKPKKGKAKRVAAGGAKLTVAGGKSATPTIKLSKAAKGLLRSKGKLVLNGTVVVTDSAGNKRSFAVKTTVKPAAKKKPKQR